MLKLKSVLIFVFFFALNNGLNAQALVCHIQTSSDPMAICQTKTFTLVGTSYDGSENYVKHQWSGPEGIFRETRDNIAILNTSNAGRFQITYTVWDDEDQSASFSMDIQILPLASKEIIVKQSFFKRIFGKRQHMRLLAEKGHAAYQWHKDNEMISGATHFELKINESGRYRVEIETSQGCKSSAIIEIPRK